MHDLLMNVSGWALVALAAVCVWVFLDLRVWVKKIAKKQTAESRTTHDWRVLLKTQQDLIIDQMNALPCVKDQRLRPVAKLAMPDNGGVVVDEEDENE